MLVSNKHFTPVIGLDIHIVLLLGFPVPLPHPYIGFVIDPMDYIPFLGATTKINHVPRGKSDTSGMIIILFHIPMGGPFLLAPMIGHDSVNFFGSKRVKVEGNMMSPSGHMLMTCNDIGIPLSLQPGKKLKPIPSMYLPTSFSIPLSFGRPVMVGGPYVPDWAGALLNLVMSFGFGALMKGIGKLGKKALTRFNHSLQGKIGSNKLSRALCKKGFEPVDLVQGIVIYDGVDFELPGPIPLKWERSWNSDSPFNGILGHGTHCSYDMRIYDLPAEAATVILLGDGRTAVFDALPYAGNSDYNRHEKLTLTRTDLDQFELIDHKEHLSYHFHLLHPQDQQYRLYAIRNDAGFTISFHYNAKGYIIKVVDSAGRHLQLTNDPEGRITNITAQHRGAFRRMVSYAYNEAGDLSAITDALDQATRIEYHDHRMQAKTDRNGQSFYWEYDRSGRCIHTWGDGGVLEGHIAYHPEKGYNEVTNAQGHTTTYYYMPQFVVTQIKDPLGNSKFFDYTPNFEIYREIDEEANVTGYSYDERGNCIAVELPDGSAYTYSYDAMGRPLLAKDPQGATRTYIYYKKEKYKGQLHTITASNGSLSIFRYNEQNLVSRIEDEQEHFTRLEYDQDCNLASMALPDGGHSSWEYDPWGNCIRTTNPLAQTQYFVYDDLNRVREVRTPDGNHLHLQYNAYEEVTHARDKHHDVQFEYTPMGRLKLREERGAKIHFIYNKDEQLSALVNEHGDMYRFTRNSKGDIIQETGFDGLVRRYTRDATGKILTIHRPGQRWTNFEYDYNGRITRTEHSDGSWATYSYNRSGLLVEAMNEHSTLRLQRDAMGHVIEEWQDGHTVASTYDSSNRRKSIQSSLGAQLQVARNAMGDVIQMSALAAGMQHPWQAQIERDLSGEETTRLLPGGITSQWIYSPAGLPESHTVTSSGANNNSANNNSANNNSANNNSASNNSASNNSASNNNASNNNATSDSISNGISNHVLTSGAFANDAATSNIHPQGRETTRRRLYRWDANRQLQQLINALGKGSQRFGHDEFGNLAWAQYEDGHYDYRQPDKAGNLFNTPLRQDRKYGPGGKLLETANARFIYDEEGFLLKKISGAETWEYEWYGNGMLKQVLRPDGRSVSFRYDALGRRTEKLYKGTITRFVWNGNAPLHEWTYPAAERPSITIDELGDLRQDHPEPVPAETLTTWIFDEDYPFIPAAQLTAGKENSIITDHQGTPCEAYDHAGKQIWSCELDIYGKVRTFTGDKQMIPFRFQGQYEDAETGLYYNRFRYYSPEEGTYLSQDPIRINGGLGMYAYVADPLVWLDPIGLIPVYRNLRPDEDISNGISARKPGRGMTPSGHIMNGSRSTFKGSQYISTTTDPDVAEHWRKSGQTTITFDTDDVVHDTAGNKSLVDVSTPEKAKAAGLKGRPYANAVSSHELLVEGHVPADKIHVHASGCK